MVNYTEKQVKYWHEWPAKRANKWSYILKNGVLYYAVPVLVVAFLFDKKTYSQQWELREVLIKAAVWFLAGLVWGYMMYKAQEKGHKKYTEQQNRT